MRKNAEIKGHRSASAAVLLVGGGAIAVATWASGDHGFAIGLAIAYVIFAAIALAWAGGKGDVAAVLRVGWDERQRGLDRDQWRSRAWCWSWWPSWAR